MRKLALFLAAGLLLTLGGPTVAAEPTWDVVVIGAGGGQSAVLASGLMAAQKIIKADK